MMSDGDSAGGSVAGGLLTGGRPSATKTNCLRWRVSIVTPFEIRTVETSENWEIAVLVQKALLVGDSITIMPALKKEDCCGSE